MKNSSLGLLMLFSTAILMSSTCKKDNYKVADTLKLNATINDTNEVIRLGDTLKITLVIPDVLNAFDINGLPNNVSVNNLQEAWYAIRFSKLDTITKTTTVLWGNTPYNFTTVGYTDGFGVYTTTANKPYASVLNIVAPSKGIYTLAVSLTPGHLKANNNGYLANLVLNFAVADKHWVNYAAYFSYGPELLASLKQQDAEGFGFYCFRVN